MAVFGHGRFVCFLQTDMALVLCNPCLDGMARLPDVDLTILRGHTVHVRGLECEVSLCGLYEAGDLLRG